MGKAKPVKKVKKDFSQDFSQYPICKNCQRPLRIDGRDSHPAWIGHRYRGDGGAAMDDWFYACMESLGSHYETQHEPEDILVEAVKRAMK